jgi:hypothetical protein
MCGFYLWRLRLLLYPGNFRMNITGGFTPAYYCSLGPPVSASFRKSNMTVIGQIILLRTGKKADRINGSLVRTIA